MRMLLKVSFPNEPFNSMVLDGTIVQKMGGILEAMKPEAHYFTEENGRRMALFVVDVDRPSRIPSLAEPWFLAFNAECRFQIAMTVEDIVESGFDKMGSNPG